MQSKKDSLKEVLTNTFIGMAGSWLITFIVLNTVDGKINAATATTILCTIWSISRGWVIRRHFNRKLTEGKP